MRIEVDQSGKVEQLNCDTVIAFSNDKQNAILLPKSIKRQLFLTYGARVKQLMYKLFCICVHYCLRNCLYSTSYIVVDCEYEGNENLIKSILLNYIRTAYKEFDSKLLRFERVGKMSNAHILALDVFRRNRKPNKILSLNEIEELLRVRNR